MQTSIIPALLAAVLASATGMRAVAAQPFHSRARLGIAALSISPELRKHFGAPADRGVLVDAVLPDSAAARAGVHVGDIVTDVDGDAAGSASDIVEAMSDRKKGDDIAVDVIRDHNHVELRAKLAADAPAADTLPDDLDSWFQFDDPHGAFEQLRKQMHELEEHAKSSMPHGERT